MSEWKEYKLGEISDVQTGPFGSQLHKEQYVKNGTPIVTVEHLGNKQFSTTNLPCVTDADKDRLSKYIAYEGDVIFSRVGSVDRCSYVDKNTNGWLFSGRCLRVRPFTNICGEFLYYYFNLYATKQYIRNSAVGTTMPSINTTILSEVPISLPTYDTQRRIASILSSLDDKISVNKKICENLEAQAQALFKHWFIDFAPFKDGKFVESELGMIPEGWRVGTLGEYVDNLNGYSYKGNELQPSTTAMVTIKNFVRGGGFKIEGFKEIVVSKKIKEYQYISLFDVLVAHTDLTQKAEVVGNPAIILSTGDYDKLVMSMDLTKVVPKDARITTPLLHSILSTRKFKEHALGYVNGTTVLHMNKKAVPEYCFAIPKNLDILKGLTAILDNIYRMMSEIYAENLRLSTLRDTLLPRLMSGQIKL